MAIRRGTAMRDAIVVALVLSLAPAAWAGQQVKPIESLSAYDANGKRVGRVLDMTGTNEGMIVPVSVKGVVTYLSLYSDTLVAGNGGVLYQSTDCTGTAYVGTSSFGFAQLVTGTGLPGLTVYVQESGQPTQSILVASRVATETGCEAVVNPFMDSAFPAVPLVDLSAVFTPPFTVH